jgi:hypothetical protein
MCVLEITGWDHFPADTGLNAIEIADLLSGNTDLTPDEIDDAMALVQGRGCVIIPMARLYDEHSISCVKQALEEIGATVEIRN